MNLEEELATLESQSTMMQQPVNNVNANEMINSVNEGITNTMNNVNEMTQNIPMNNNFNTMMQAPVQMGAPVSQPQYQQPIQNQPAMVNTNQAAQQASGFNYANLEFDINKPLFERNPLERLTGDKGETFRIHMLPNVSPSQVHVHWDAEKGHNFVCLKDVYGTPGEPCCGTHEQAKLRVVIPIIVYPTMQGNPNMLLQGQKAELKTLVLGYKQFQDLQNQANLAGVILTQGDIFATVDNPTYKSFNFTVRQDSLISQVPNAAEIEAKWKEVGTPENICKACGRVITREEYEAAYSNYDANKYKNQANTPTQGVAPSSYTFNTPMPQGGYQQPYGMGGMNQNQPFYNGQQSTTFGGQYNNQTNPWQ